MLITNARLITWEEKNRILIGNAIYIKDGQIGEIGTEENLKEKYPYEEEINAHSQFVYAGKHLCTYSLLWGFCEGIGYTWKCS